MEGGVLSPSVYRADFLARRNNDDDEVKRDSLVDSPNFNRRSMKFTTEKTIVLYLSIINLTFSNRSDNRIIIVIVPSFKFLPFSFFPSFRILSLEFPKFQGNVIEKLIHFFEPLQQLQFHFFHIRSMQFA